MGVSQISYQRKRRNTDPVVYLPVVNQMELPHTIQTHDDVPFSVGKFRKTDQVSVSFLPNLKTKFNIFKPIYEN